MEELFGGLIFFYVILIIAIIGYTIYKKEKINQQIDDLANNVL